MAALDTQSDRIIREMNRFAASLAFLSDAFDRAVSEYGAAKLAKALVDDEVEVAA